MKKIAVSVLLFSFFASLAGAQTGETSLGRWLRLISYKLSAAQKETKKDTAVTGVKGIAEETSAEELYWKEAVSREELERFREGYNYAKEGNREKAIESLEAFLKDYPQSPFRKDAEEGLTALKEDAAPSR